MTAPYVPDRDRAARIGIEEAVLCAGKADEHLAHIVDEARGRGASMFLTRLDAGAFANLPAELRDAIDYEPLSRTGVLGEPQAVRGTARVAVVTAGTSDIAVAREAERTLAYAGEASAGIHDIGVAGLWRLAERAETLCRFPVVIVVAGMDGALVSAIGGLVPGSVIAVPTSTGYGVARAGETALHAALASCASGVVAVNIDNGYGAACAALRILNGGNHRSPNESGSP